MKNSIIIMGLALIKMEFFQTYFIEPEQETDQEQCIDHDQIERGEYYNKKYDNLFGLKQRIKFKDYHYY